MKRKGRIENLKPWRKGESGNPLGRPRSAAIGDALRAQLQETAPDNAQSVAEELASVLINQARQGDVRAIAEVADRSEGRPAQRVETATSGQWMYNDPARHAAEVDRLMMEVYGLPPADEDPVTN